MTAPAIRELLAGCAARRERTADDHMFTVTRGGYRAGTFRLQLFTAPGARPVAVATQGPAEGGSLTNRAETYAAEVWRRHVPDSAEPPVLVSLELLHGIADPEHERFTLVSFDVAGRHELASPSWCRMSDEDLAQLVGQPVTRERGEGYQPWPREPDPEPVYQVAWVIALPGPRGVNRGCMSGPPPWRQRLARQLLPRRETLGCCYYHGTDWRAVSAAAVRVVRRARREGLACEAISERASALAAAQNLPPEEEEALAGLLTSHSGIQPGRRVRLGRRGYTNGRHRTAAMLAGGVRRTVVIRWRYPPPAREWL